MSKQDAPTEIDPERWAASDATPPRLRDVARRQHEREMDPVYREKLAELAAQIETFELNERNVVRRLSLRRSRVPEAAMPYLGAPTETKAVKEVAAFLAEPPAKARFLTLAGPRGRGKTVALAWALAQQGGRFYEAQELVQLSTFDRMLWDDMAAAQILAIDELGAEQGNTAFDANLYSVLNGRFRRERKTILATNLVAVDFKARYLARDGGLDRLYERLVTGGRWVNLPGESMRGAGRP